MWEVTKGTNVPHSPWESPKPFRSQRGLLGYNTVLAVASIQTLLLLRQVHVNSKETLFDAVLLASSEKSQYTVCKCKCRKLDTEIAGNSMYHALYCAV